MQFPVFRKTQDTPPDYRRPEPAVLPSLPSLDVFALYRQPRSGGDFYDFVLVDSYLLFLLCDVSGKREDALPVAAGVQDIFRKSGRELFGVPPINTSDRLTGLTLALNRGILEIAGGVHHCPAFLGCYHPETGTLAYVNAGHPPALLRDGQEILPLEANGIPLGLFSHAIHETQFCVLRPGASLLLASRGIMETRNKNREFGIERLTKSLGEASFDDARQLCTAIQAAVRRFAPQTRPQNDMTALALVRARAQAQRFTG